MGKEEIRRRICDDIYQLLVSKGDQYGDTYTDVPQILYILFNHKWDGTHYKLTKQDIDHMLAIVRVLDKICRIARGNQGSENAWFDIAGYAVLEMEKDMKKEDRL